MKTVDYDSLSPEWLDVLSDVQGGERYLIVREGLPVAEISAVNLRNSPEDIRKGAAEVREFFSLGGLSLKALKEEGRR